MNLVAPVANMLMAAIAKGGWRRDERPEHHNTATSGPARDDLCPAIDPHASPRAHRIDRAPICIGRGGPASRLGRLQDRDYRRRLGAFGGTASGRVGFKELVSRVCLGEVGAIFGL